MGRQLQSSGNVGFDVFWSCYPKKVKKILALKAWQKLKGFNLSDVLAGIERWKQSAQWQDLQYAPDPERFLKYRRWEDEVPISAMRRELYAGTGPSCTQAHVRPKVLERIRRREEQKAQIARKG